MRKVNHPLRMLAALLAFVMILTLMPLSVFAQGGNATQTDEKLWPATGNERQIFKHVSAGWTDDDSRITTMQYNSTTSEDGSINIKVTHSGVTYSTTRDLFPEYYWNFIQDGQGWSYVAMRFEKDLYDAVDFSRSYITCEGRTVYFNDASMSQKDLPRVINGVAHVKAFAYEDVFGYMNRWQTKTADLKLFLKPGAKLETGRQYRMEHRVLRRASDTDNILIREWVTGVDGRDDQFANSRHRYSQSTYVTPIAYGVPPKQEKYLTKADSNQYDTILGSMMDMEADWQSGLLTVRYYFDTNDMDHPNNQFVELMPYALKDCLVPDIYGNVAYHSYLNRFGRVNNYNNNSPSAYDYDPVPIRMTNFTWDKEKGLGGIRFRNDRYAGQDQQYGFNKSDYAWVNPWDYTWNYRPFYWRGTSMAPVQNVIVYRVNPTKLLEAFGGNLDELKFKAFFIGPKDGKLIPRSVNNVNGIAFPRTEVNPRVNEPIFTDSEVFTGNTRLGKNGIMVQVTVSDTKGNATEVLSNSDTGNFTFDNNTTNVTRFDNLKADLRKGDIITFKNMNLTCAYGASSGTKVKVKARVRFRDNEEKIGPNYIRYYEPLFVENGVEKNFILADDKDTLTKLPKAPERKGYELVGYTKKPIADAKDYDALPELTEASQWQDNNNYKFTTNSKLDRSQVVYAVWKKAQDGIKIVLHDNKGAGADTENPVTLTFEEATALPDYGTLTGKACPDFDKQVNYATGVNPDSLLPNAYTFDDTQTNKDVKTIFTEKEENGRKYTLVGWSTDRANGDQKVEDLFNNRAILSKKTEGETTKYYLTKVATKVVYDAQGHAQVGQAAAARLTQELTPDENGVINLYAAWKPYYDVKVTKSWYDGTQNKTNTIREKFDNIVHGNGSYTTPLDPQGDIKVGLIRRTAVTEANSPTVTPVANYYTVPDSLKDLKKGQGPITWQVPGFDNYGKRYSYVAIEFNPEEAEARYNGFAQRWSNIWTEVFDNSGDKTDKNGQGSDWTDTTITKIQSLALNNATGGVDAYSGATIRKLTGDSKGLDSKVSQQGAYDINLYNIKVDIEAPAILDVFDGDNYFYFKQYDKDFVMKLQLPEIRQDVYMLYNKANKTWERVDVDSNNKIIPSAEKNISIVEENLGNELDASGQSVPVNVWKLNYLNDQGKASSDNVFRRGQKITAQYYQFNNVSGERSLTTTKSEVTAKVVKDKLNAPTLRDLTQARKDGNNIIITANAPVADLGQFTQGAKIYLADPETGKRILRETGKPEEKGPYTDDDFILAERSGGIYVFKVPEKIVKHGDQFTALNTDVNKKDARSAVPVTIDTEAPKVTLSDKTAFIGEDFRFENVITTDEDANVQFDKLPAGAEIENPSSQTVFYKNWTVKGNVTDKSLAANYVIKLNVEDRFGNATMAEWKLEVKERPETNAGFEAKQAKNDPKTNIDISNGVNGANIKVYLVDPATNPDASPIAVSGVVDGKAKIYIEDQYIPKIANNGNSVYLVQEEEGKRPSSPTKVLPLDVIPPAVPAPSAEPRSSIVHLTQPAADVTEITITVEGTSKTIRKTNQGKWVDERSRLVTDKNTDGLDVEFDQKKFNPDKEIVVTAKDAIGNQASASGYVGSAKAPNVEIKGKAYNGTDNIITTVESTEAIKDVHQVYVYKPVLENGKPKEIKTEVEEVVDNNGKKETVKKEVISYEKDGQPIGRGEVDANGNFKITLSPQLPAGTDLLLVPVRYEVEGEPTKVTVIADKNGNGIDDALEPFNPETVKSMEVKDPTKMNYPKVDDTSDMKLKLEGMEVTLVDEFGKKAVVSYGQDGAPTVKSVEGPQDKQEEAKTALTNKLANLTTAPAKDAVLTVEANDKKPIDVTYKVKEGEEVKGQTTPIRVFLDKNKNGIPDNEEGFDWNNLDPNGTKVDNWPKMEYKDKEAMDLSGLLVTLKDTTGKVKTLAYGTDEKGNKKDDFTAEKVLVTPAQDAKLSAENTPEGQNGANLVLILKQAKDEPKITLVGKTLKVIYDSDNNGIDDREEATKLEDVKALNRGDMPTKTTVTGKTEPGAKVTVGATEVVAKQNGEFEVIVDKVNAGQDITVKAEIGHKKPTEKTVTVQEDKNNNGIPDELEADLTVTGKAINIGDTSPTLVSGKTKPNTKVEITTEDGKTFTAVVDSEGNFLTSIPHQKDGSKVKVKAIYESKHGTEVGPEATFVVYPDYNNDGVDDRLVPKFDNVVEGDKVVKVDDNSISDEIAEVEVKVGSDTKTFKKGSYGWNETGKSGQDIRPDANGKLPFPVDSTKVVTGAKVTVTLHKGEESGSATKTVLGKAFTDAKVEPIKDGDEAVVISEIPDGVKEITIKDGANNEKTITKDGDNWKDGETVLTPDQNGKITVPKSDKQTFKQGDVAKVILKDPDSPSRDHEQLISVGAKDKTTKPEDVKALNKGENPTSTTVTGKVDPKATVKILDENGKDITPADIKVNPDGTFTAEIKPIKKDGDKIQVIATEPGKGPSDPIDAVVKTDKDGNGIADNEENFDIAKAAKIELAANPTKMDYLVRTQDGTVKFEAAGLLVRVTDKAGKEKLYNADQIKAETKFAIEPADGSDLTIDANNGQKVKVILNVDGLTPNFVETTKALSVKLDANGNGIPDDQEKFDITSATKVEILNNPTKMDYLVTTADGKAKFDTKGLVIRLTDANGKTVNYAADELEKAGIKDKITLSPANGQELGLAAEGKTNTMDFTVTVNGAKADPKPSVTADKKVTVKLDANGDGIADEDQATTAPKDVKALNKGENPTSTTVTGKVTPGSEVKILDKDGNNITPADITVKPDGTFTAEIKPKKNDGDKIKVVATEPGKKASDPVEATVKTDKDGDGVADTEQDFDIKKAAKIAMVRDPNKMDYLVRTQDGKAKFEVYGMLVKVTDKAGKEKLYNAEQVADDQTNFKIEPANGEKIGLDKNGQKAKVTLLSAPQDMTAKEVETSKALSVKLDANGNGIADEDEVFDIAKTKSVRILEEPNKMAYEIDKKDGTTKFETAGLVIELTDVTGKTVKYTASELNALSDKITIAPANGADIGLAQNGKKLKVTVKSATGTEKPTVESTKAITVEIKAPAAPVVDPIKSGDDKVVVEKPAIGDEIVVTLPDNTEVKVTKDPETGNWTTPDVDENGQPKTDPSTGQVITKDVPVNNDGKLEIPVDKNKVTEGDVRVAVKDNDSGKTTEVVVKIEKAAEEIQIKLNNLKVGSRALQVTTSVGKAKVVVSVAGEEIGEFTTNAFGYYSIPLSSPLDYNQVVLIKATKDGYLDGEFSKTFIQETEGPDFSGL